MVSQKDREAVPLATLQSVLKMAFKRKKAENRITPNLTGEGDSAGGAGPSITEPGSPLMGDDPEGGSGPS